jgi:hypothetical protein
MIVQRVAVAVLASYAVLGMTGAIAAAQNASSTCTLCADGKTEPVGMIGTTDCSVIATSLANAVSGTDSSLCLDTQLQGYKFCNCSALPTGYCSMCDTTTGSAYVSLPTKYSDWIVPGTTNLTCAEAEFQQSDVCYSDAAWYCGCESAKRGVCSLCSDNTVAPNDRYLPPDFTKTCAMLDREGGAVYAASDCSSAMMVQFAGFDSQNYCGCSVGAGTTNNTVTGCFCDIINPDLVISDAGVKCSDLTVVTNFITTSSGCDELVSKYGTLCCSEIVPTIAPVSSSSESAVPGQQQQGGGTTTPSPTAPGGDSSNRGTAPTPTKQSSSASLRRIPFVCITLPAFFWGPIVAFFM